MGHLKSRPNFIDGVSDVLGIMLDRKGRVEFKVIERLGVDHPGLDEEHRAPALGRPGLILVELAGPRSAIHIEDFISFAPGEVSIYPTGIWSSGE
jgi:hypothetical protein